MQGTVTLLEPLNTKNSSKKLAFFIKCASIYKETSIPVLTNVIIISLAFLSAWKTPCVDAKVLFCA